MNAITRKIACLFVFTFLIGAIFTSAVSAATYPPYPSWDSLTVSTNLPGAGSVYPGSGHYADGSTVVCYEQTNLGYSFNGWYLNGVYEGQLSSIPIIMNQNYNLQAVFSVQLVTLTITANPPNGGTIAPGTGIWNYTSGNSVTLTESPKSGFTFSGWYVDGTYEGTGTGITIPMGMDHQINAFFAGSSSNPTPQPTIAPPTPTPEPTPASNHPSPSLSFYCASSTTYAGFNVRIQGDLAYNGTGLSGTGILLSYSNTGGNTWQDLAYVTTGDDGSFTCVWMPSASGNYAIMATWLGDSAYSSASSTDNFAVAPVDNQDQNVFSVTSNSTLTSLAFDSTQNQLSFTVSGPKGTIGYAQVCIPKSLMTDASELTAMVDSKTVNYATYAQGDVWLITIHYHHSTHAVVINLNPQTSTASSGPTETPSSTSAPNSTTFGNLLGGQLIFVVIIAVLVAVIAVLLILNRRKTKSAKTL